MRQLGHLADSLGALELELLEQEARAARAPCDGEKIRGILPPDDPGPSPTGRRGLQKRWSRRRERGPD
jgi:hypothetical protein